MRLCMDRLPKHEMHGQKPVVTLPTKQALNQFESQQKTRPIPPVGNISRGQAPNCGQSVGFQGGPQQGHPPRMMPPNGPPGGYRPQHMPLQNMQGPIGPNQGPPRMQVIMRNTMHGNDKGILSLLTTISLCCSLNSVKEENIAKCGYTFTHYDFITYIHHIYLKITDTVCLIFATISSVSLRIEANQAQLVSGAFV